jgi:hypothetical protein
MCGSDWFKNIGSSTAVHGPRMYTTFLFLALAQLYVRLNCFVQRLLFLACASATSQVFDVLSASSYRCVI